MIVAAILRLSLIDRAAFWYDEGITAIFARLPFPKMIAATAGDVHPPGYYMIGWAMDKVGIPITELTLRLPSVLLSLLAVYMTWLLVKHFDLSREAEFLAVAWIAGSPLQLHYAQEARMYALLQVEVIGLLLLLLEERWAALSVLLTVTLYTHNYALIYAPTLAFVVLARKWPDVRAALKKAPYFIAPVLAWVPWLFVLLNQMGEVAAGYWIQKPTAGSILFVFYQLLFAYSMPRLVQGLAVMVTAGLITYSIWRVIRDKTAKYKTLLIMSFVPVTLALVASYAWKPILLFRGLIGSSIPLVVLIVYGLDQITLYYKRVFAVIMIWFVIMAGTVGHLKYNAENKGRADEWVAMIEEKRRPGDAVAVLNDNGYVALKTYAPQMEVYKLPSCEREALGSLSPATRRSLGVIEKDIREIKAGRIWYISTIAPVSTKCETELTEGVIENYDAKLIEALADNEYNKAGVYLIND